MKGFILVILAIIAVVIVAGGAAALHVMSQAGIGIEDINPSNVGDVVDKVSNVASSAIL